MASTAFSAFLHDGESRRVARELDQDAVIRRGTVRSAAREFQSAESSDIVLVDLDGEQNPLAHMAALLRVCRPETVILATGTENNVTLANDLYRGGVFLYLPKPLSAADLSRGLREVEAAHDEERRPEIQTSQLILVLGKGMGTNTLTAVLARLAAERGRYVSCLDLDPNFGTLSLALDAAPERGLAQALQSTGPISVERLQARVSPRISLIAHPFDQVGQATQPGDDDRGLPELVNALTAHAHVILASGASLSHVEALRHAVTTHLVVFEPTPAGLSVAARWLRVLEGAASTLVLNRPRPLPSLVNPDQIRSNLGDRAPDVELPYIKAMARAMALGEPERAISRRDREALDVILGPLTGVAGQATDDD